MDLEEDWSDLRLRKPVVPTGELLEDLVEDWDLLQGKNSWFVGLYDTQLKLIPGTIRRVEEALLHETIEWRHIPYQGTVAFTGYWSRTRQRQFAKFEKPIDLEPGQSFGVKLQLNWAFVPSILTLSTSTISAATNSTTFTISLSNCGTNTYPIEYVIT